MSIRLNRPQRPPEPQRALGFFEVRKLYDRLALRNSLPSVSFPIYLKLLEDLNLQGAQHIFEFGCGTGHFAKLVLLHSLSQKLTYRAVDLSPTMVRITQHRLTGFPQPSRVTASDGRPLIPALQNQFDRIVSVFVLDHLSDSEIDLFLSEAHRTLKNGGLLAIASLTEGASWTSRGLIGIWKLVNRIRPQWRGGRRPIQVLGRIAAEKWAIENYSVKSQRGLPAEILVLRKKDF